MHLSQERSAALAICACTEGLPVVKSTLTIAIYLRSVAIPRMSFHITPCMPLVLLFCGCLSR